MGVETSLFASAGTIVTVLSPDTFSRFSASFLLTVISYILPDSNEELIPEMLRPVPRRGAIAPDINIVEKQLKKRLLQ